MIFRNRVLRSLCLVVLLTIGACGGNPAADDGGLATLESGESAGTTTTTAPQTQEDAEEAALAFSQCMRDEGVTDFPDPSFEDGGMTVAIGGPDGEGGIDFQSEEVQAAFEECGSLMGGVAMGPGGGDFDVTELQDDLLAMAECLRDQGLDVDDPDLSNFGPAVGRPIPSDDDSSDDSSDGASGAAFESTDGGEVQGFSIFGDLDMNDPEVREAMETCQGELGMEPRIGTFQGTGE